MISYNTKDWFTFIFHFHKSDTFRKLFWLIIGICIYSGIIAYLEVEIFRLSADSYLRQLSLMHSLLGFAISMLLVFRTNTAYDRWWEGRKQWGALVNTSRNLAIKLSAMLGNGNGEDILFFRKTIPAYASALKDHLGNETTRLELFDNDAALMEQIDHKKHIPNQIAGMMMHWIMELYRKGVISGEQLIILNTDLQAFTDVCGACERIKNTPIPFSYTVFIKKFIFVYIMTLPFGYVFNLGYLVIPVVGFVFYVLASLELIAEEIEDPFGGDANDVPTAKIAHNIETHIHELL